MTKLGGKRIGLGLAALALCGGISQSAWAWDHGFHHRGGFHDHDGFHDHGGFHHHDGFHSHFGVFIGAPLFWWPPEPYYYPPYDYPPVSQVYVEQPPVYVQRNDTAANTPPAANYWYYCPNPQGYYPYVQNCPAGWMQVVPQAPQR